MSRIKKTIINARINLIFYTVNLFLSFYSRKFFLVTLGATFLGLSSTMSNILGFLNLTELGIGTAIIYLLFKPIADNNKEEIIYIVSLLRSYYKKIGLFILLGGIFISIFIPFIFRNSSIDLGIIYLVYFVFLISTFFEYYFNYKQLILIADQKNYLKISYIGTSNIIKVLSQIIFLTYFENKIIIFLIIEISFSIVNVFLINFMIKKHYSWIKTTTNFNHTEKLNIEVKSKTKQIFSHQIAGYILSQTDQLLIFTFTSLSMVTYYMNYSLLLVRGISIIDQLLNSSNASIGNLVASEDKKRIIKIFSEILTLRYWISGIIVYTAYNIVPPFIEVWLGKQFLLDNNILILMLINSYIIMTRQPIDAFIYAFGIFNDTWAPWVEASLNLLISVVAGYYFGITGILLGTFVSMLSIVVIWKPLLLYSKGFKLKIIDYWFNIFKYVTTFSLCCVFTYYITKDFNFIYFKIAYFNILIQACIISFLFAFSYFFALYTVTNSMKNLLKRFNKLIISKYL